MVEESDEGKFLLCRCNKSLGLNAAASLNKAEPAELSVHLSNHPPVIVHLHFFHFFHFLHVISLFPYLSILP